MAFKKTTKMAHTIEELEILIDYADVTDNIWLKHKLEQIKKSLTLKTK
tara:strand:- start:730 stop:873 length:144 start_codon:yes stop_codon:yes gene_type:complete